MIQYNDTVWWYSTMLQYNHTVWWYSTTKQYNDKVERNSTMIVPNWKENNHPQWIKRKVVPSTNKPKLKKNALKRFFCPNHRLIYDQIRPKINDLFHIRGMQMCEEKSPHVPPFKAPSDCITVDHSVISRSRRKTLPCVLFSFCLLCMRNHIRQEIFLLNFSI